MDSNDIKQILKRLDLIEESSNVILKRLASIENNINRIDHDLKILEDLQLNFSKVHGEQQTQTEEMGIIREKLDENKKITEAVGEEIKDKIEESNE